MQRYRTPLRNYLLCSVTICSSYELFKGRSRENLLQRRFFPYRFYRPIMSHSCQKYLPPALWLLAEKYLKKFSVTIFCIVFFFGRQGVNFVVLSFCVLSQILCPHSCSKNPGIQRESSIVWNACDKRELCLALNNDSKIANESYNFYFSDTGYVLQLMNRFLHFLTFAQQIDSKVF